MNRLTAQVADVTQFNESDWAFLRRLGGRYGLWLLARSGQVELTATAGGDCVTLTSGEIIADDEEVTLRSAVAGAQSRAWQFPLGQTPASADKPRLVRGFATEDFAGEQGERLSGVSQTQEFMAALAPGWGNAEEAGRLVRIQQASLLSWSGSILRPELAVGHRFRLPEAIDLGAPLVIARRQLSYSPFDGNYQLVNRVLAGSDLSDPDAILSPDEVLSVPGIVLSVQDAAHIGRIRVRFPWQGDGEGLWCLGPQPEGGDGHGVVHLPSPGDWVVVSFQTDGLLPPVVIGSIYHSGAQASAKVQNPAQQRILARTAAGHLILLDDEQGEIIVAIQPGKEPACSVVLKKDPAAITVHVPAGKVVVQAGQAKLTLGDDTIRAEADSIELTGNKSITLTAPQVAVNATGGVTVSSSLTVQQ
ncbi:MAG: phage baseplate assembly protein V [Pirellulales bacterium]